MRFGGELPRETPHPRLESFGGFRKLPNVRTAPTLASHDAAVLHWLNLRLLILRVIRSARFPSTSIFVGVFAVGFAIIQSGKILLDGEYRCFISHLSLAIQADLVALKPLPSF